MDPLPKTQEATPSEVGAPAVVDRPLMLTDLTKAVEIVEQQFEKRFALKDHDHAKYVLKNDLSSLTGDLRQHAINLTEDAKKYTDSLEEKLHNEYEAVDSHGSVEAIVAWFVLAFIIIGTIALFTGLALWYRPLAWIAGGISLLVFAAVLINVFIGGDK